MDYMLLIRDLLQTEDTCRLKVKGRKKIFHANRYKKGDELANLASDKTYFKTKNVKKKKGKDRHYIIIKGKIQEEDKTM